MSTNALEIWRGYVISCPRQSKSRNSGIVLWQRGGCSLTSMSNNTHFNSLWHFCSLYNKQAAAVPGAVIRKTCVLMVVVGGV